MRLEDFKRLTAAERLERLRAKFYQKHLMNLFDTIDAKSNREMPLAHRMITFKVIMWLHMSDSLSKLLDKVNDPIVVCGELHGDLGGALIGLSNEYPEHIFGYHSKGHYEAGLYPRIIQKMEKHFSFLAVHLACRDYNEDVQDKEIALAATEFLESVRPHRVTVSAVRTCIEDNF